MSKFAIGDRVNRTIHGHEGGVVIACSQQTMATSDTRSIWKDMAPSNFFPRIISITPANGKRCATKHKS